MLGLGLGPENIFICLNKLVDLAIFYLKHFVPGPQGFPGYKGYQWC